MKRLVLVIVLLFTTLVVGITTAQAIEPKVSYFWEADNSQFITLIGTSVKEDIVIKGLDIDFWYKWQKPITEVTYDSIENVNNLVMPGVSYNIDIKGWDVGLNAAIGQDRIENIKDLGETKYGIGICLGHKI